MRQLACVWLIAATPVLASGELSPVDVPPLGFYPTTGMLQLAASGAFEQQADAQRGALLADLRLGLPWKFGVRARVPMLLEPRAQLRSPIFGVAWQAGLRLRPISVHGMLEGTVQFGQPGAERGATPVQRSVLPTNVPFAVSAMFVVRWDAADLDVRWAGSWTGPLWQQLFALAWMPSDAPLWLSAGVELTETRRYAVASLGYRWLEPGRPQLQLSAHLPFEGHGFTIGLSAAITLDVFASRGKASVEPLQQGGDAAELRVPLSATPIAMLGVPGKYTLIEFGAAWCGPCRVLRPALLDLARRRPELALRFVDVDFSPGFAAAQKVSALPTLVLLGPEGAELARGHLGIRQIEALLTPLPP